MLLLLWEGTRHRDRILLLGLDLKDVSEATSINEVHELESIGMSRTCHLGLLSVVLIQSTERSNV
jgi:hypothetical protein